MTATPVTPLASVTPGVDRNIFVVPVLDRYLVYAPLHDVASIVDRAAVDDLAQALSTGSRVKSPSLMPLRALLAEAPEPEPEQITGPFIPPFLALLPTRACNLACHYCSFWTPETSQTQMPLSIARESIDWYLKTLAEAGRTKAEVHFFGGEPFAAPRVVDFAVYYARMRARELGISVRFEATSNGAYPESRVRWIADHFDSIVLSLDGPADVHDAHRPRPGERGSFEQVAQSARLFAAGPIELCLRACVTSKTVERMAEIADWFCREFRPEIVCFEAIDMSDLAAAADILPPDPVLLAQNYLKAKRVLESYGVKAVFATAEIDTRQISFCPVGKDVAIVSPDGSIGACYLLERDWDEAGVDMRLGRMVNGTAHLDPASVERVRRSNVREEGSCQGCFSQWHCSGGCHVNHLMSGETGDYDRLCLHTRLINLGCVLEAMGESALADAVLADPAAVAAINARPSDRLLD